MAEGPGGSSEHAGGRVKGNPWRTNPVQAEHKEKTRGKVLFLKEPAGRPGASLKVDCPECGRLQPAGDLRAAGARVEFSCSGCGGRYTLNRRDEKRAGLPEGSPSCPRCLRTYRAGSESCPGCGLIFDLWENGTARRPETKETPPPDAAAEELWCGVEASPEEADRHEAFLAYCRERRCLDFAAAKYQAMVAADPGNELIGGYRDRLVLLAGLTPPERDRGTRGIKRFTGLKIVLALSMAAILWAFVMIQWLGPK